jgi:hypothetical protein
MSNKYSKKELMDRLRDKYISQTEKDKFREGLAKRGWDESKVRSATSGQQALKRQIARDLSYKSERERETMLRRMGFDYKKRKQFLAKIDGDYMSPAQKKRQEKIEARKKRRNIAASNAMSEQLSDKHGGGEKGKEASLSRALTEKGAKVGHSALGIKGRSYSVSVNEGKKHSEDDFYEGQHSVSAGEQPGSRGVASGFGIKGNPSSSALGGKPDPGQGGPSKSSGAPLGFIPRR